MATIIAAKNVIPGPRALPLLGWRANMLKLFRDPFTYLPLLHKQYGNVVALAEGDLTYVCAFGPALNFQVLSKPDLFEVSAGPFQKLPENTPLVRIGGNSLQMMKGEKHRQQRRLMQPAFHRQQVAHYRDNMVTLVQRMLDRWQGRSEIDLSREMELLTRSVTVKALFGLDNEAEIDQLGNLLERMVAQIPLAMIAPINVPGTPYYQTQRLAAQLETALQSMIARKRTQTEAHDLLSVLIHAHDEDGTTLHDKELVSHAFTLFSAGFSTTSAALTWTIFLLGQHPRIYERLVDELLSVLHGEPPTIEQLKQLAYLDAVVKESLRILPPGGIGQRRATAPCELGGYELPAGSTIIYSEYLTHRLPELYEEPDRFKPERWNTLNRTAYEYLPFSAGQHRCIGADFALQEAKLALATLLQRYRLEIVPNTTIKLDLTMHPKYGLPARVLPQDRQFSRIPVRGNIRQIINLDE
ncbi:cytochrome P450 [Reticulibacter mediterranei]|uniref:Cytochrome P450 n=1 Tax=Reticulibacter mediterranei TaxID=2778369 RepID=A0A8J3N1W4_9CHLR|nr:cytochrome P450 [Reticulibacter mediterranei]GHO92963.1 cytochrome P450 [Reticulibacter mediterranei]